MRRRSLLLAVLATACGGAVQSVTPAARAVRPTAASSASATPSPVTRAPGTCLVPLKVLANGDRVLGTLSLPGDGTLHREAGEESGAAGWSIGVNPTLTSSTGHSTRLPDGRWLPVARDHVSPDGAQYVDAPPVAAGDPLTIYLTDTRTGSRQRFATIPAAGWLVGWGGSSVFASSTDTHTHLLALDSRTGASRDLLQDATQWTHASATAVWGTATSEDADARSNTLIRYDLKTTPGQPC